MSEDKISLAVLINNENIPTDIFSSSVDKYFGPQVEDFNKSSLVFCILSESTGWLPAQENTATYIKSQWLFMTTFFGNELFEFKVAICDNRNWNIIAQETNYDKREIQTCHIECDKVFLIRITWNEQLSSSIESLTDLYSMDESFIKSHYECADIFEFDISNQNYLEPVQNLDTINEDVDDTESLNDSLQEVTKSDEKSLMHESAYSLQEKELELENDSLGNSQININRQNEIESIDDKSDTIFEKFKYQKNQDVEDADSLRDSIEDDPKKCQNEIIQTTDKDGLSDMTSKINEKDSICDIPVSDTFKNVDDSIFNSNKEISKIDDDSEMKYSSQEHVLEKQDTASSFDNNYREESQDIDRNECQIENKDENIESNTSLYEEKTTDDIFIRDRDNDTFHDLDNEDNSILDCTQTITNKDENGDMILAENSFTESSHYNNNSDNEKHGQDIKPSVSNTSLEQTFVKTLEDNNEPDYDEKDNINSYDNENIKNSEKNRYASTEETIKKSSETPLINDEMLKEKKAARMKKIQSIFGVKSELQNMQKVDIENKIKQPITNEEKCENVCSNNDEDNKLFDETTVKKEELNLDSIDIQNVDSEIFKEESSFVQSEETIIHDNDNKSKYEDIVTIEDKSNENETTEFIIQKACPNDIRKNNMKDVQGELKVGIICDEFCQSEHFSDIDGETQMNVEFVEMAAPYSAHIIENSNTLQSHGDIEENEFVADDIENPALLNDDKREENTIESQPDFQNSTAINDKSEYDVCDLEYKRDENNPDKSDINKNEEIMTTDDTSNENETTESENISKTDTKYVQGELQVGIICDEFCQSEHFSDIDHDTQMNAKMDETVAPYLTHKIESGNTLHSHADLEKNELVVDNTQGDDENRELFDKDKSEQDFCDDANKNNEEKSENAELRKIDVNIMDSININDLKTNQDNIVSSDKCDERNTKDSNSESIEMTQPKVEDVVEMFEKLVLKEEEPQRCSKRRKNENDNFNMIKEKFEPEIKRHENNSLLEDNPGILQDLKVDIIKSKNNDKEIVVSESKDEIEDDREFAILINSEDEFKDNNVNIKLSENKENEIFNNETDINNDNEFNLKNVERKYEIKEINELGRSLSLKDIKRIVKEKRERLAVNDDYKYPDSVTPTKVEHNLSKSPEYNVPFMDDEAFYNESWYEESDDRWTSLERPINNDNETALLSPVSTSNTQLTTKASIEVFKEAEVTKPRIIDGTITNEKKRKGLMNLCGCVGGR